METNQAKTPAEIVVERFGGVRTLARKLTEMGVKTEHSRISRWSLPNGDGAGVIPAKYHRPLLELARKERVRLTMKELIYGHHPAPGA